MQTEMETPVAAPLGLPPGEARILAHLDLARKTVASGDNEYRRAADNVAKANDLGASQRRIAKALRRPVSWVNQLLAWQKAEYPGAGPFARSSKAKRDRKRVQAVERAEKDRDAVAALEKALADAFCRAEAAEAETRAVKFKLERAIDDAVRHRAQLGRKPAHDRSEPDLWRIPERGRALLVKMLGMLGSDQLGERASAALSVERQRVKLGKTWDELIVGDVNDEGDE